MMLRSCGCVSTDGLAWTALLVSTEDESEKVAGALSAIPQMSLVASTSGRFDLVCEVWANDATHLMSVLDEARSIPVFGPWKRFATSAG